MKKLTGKYEKKERELFKTNYSCIYLIGVPVEDEALENEGDYLMRCFAKEYPNMQFESFDKQFANFCESGIISQIEDRFNCTLDMEGCQCMRGFQVADNISLKDMSECFEEIVSEFEKC